MHLTHGLLIHFGKTGRQPVIKPGYKGTKQRFVVTATVGPKRKKRTKKKEEEKKREQAKGGKGKKRFNK